MWSVSYTEYQDGVKVRVRKEFHSKQAAQECIDVNAMICKLPDLILSYIGLDDCQRGCGRNWNECEEAGDCADYIPEPLPELVKAYLPEDLEPPF